MRTIKFRAWDKARRQMYYVLNMTFLFETEEGILARGYCNNTISHEIFPEDLELMQFTGLLDKNGKEIYEGDVVGSASGIVSLVTWLDEGAGFIFFDKRNDNWWAPNFDAVEYSWEVIGNIYSNPELLEAK